MVENTSKIKFIFLTLLFIIFASVIFTSLVSTPTNAKLAITLDSKQINEYQVYYYTDSETEVSEENSSKLKYDGSSSTIEFKLDSSYKGVRFDIGEKSSKMIIKEISIKTLFDSYNIDLDKISVNKSNQVSKFKNTENGIFIETNGQDPYIYISFPVDIKKNILNDNELVRYVICSVFTVISLILWCILYKIRKLIFILFKDHNDNKGMIFHLSINDFKTKYAGSYLGILWAFVQPLMTILVFWVVFEVGFRSGPVESVPFILWLTAGLVPWFFFAESWANATNSLIEYSYLVKKIMFKINILPIVKILSSFYVHTFFVFLTVGFYLIYQIPPSVYWLQLIYYTICAICLSFSLSILTSTLIVFFKDLGQVISLTLQIGMWLAPILWKYTMVPETYRWILKLNPAYYLVEGYRDSLIYNVWFWERHNVTIYFWGVVIVIFILGIVLNKKLKPHFADVL